MRSVQDEAESFLVTEQQLQSDLQNINYLKPIQRGSKIVARQNVHHKSKLLLFINPIRPRVFDALGRLGGLIQHVYRAAYMVNLKMKSIFRYVT